ncbi:hypothetical protein TgHK011_006419 [Trichoderma gracile]|nr:hypothetical protein TgHK011_006419 [Trichoderma gracile]
MANLVPSGNICKPPLFPSKLLLDGAAGSAEVVPLQAKGRALCHGKGVLVVVHDEMYRHTTFASTGTSGLVPFNGSRKRAKTSSAVLTPGRDIGKQTGPSPVVSSPLPAIGTQPHRVYFVPIGRRWAEGAGRSTGASALSLLSGKSRALQLRRVAQGYRRRLLALASLAGLQYEVFVRSTVLD